MSRGRATGGVPFGAVIRQERIIRGLTLADLGARCGYSASQVSRYERGISPLTDMNVLARFADALQIPPRVFGLTGANVRHGDSRVVPGSPGGDGDVRRRDLLASLALTATAPSAGRAGLSAETAQPGELLAARIRDAMLTGMSPVDRPLTPTELPRVLAAAHADFHAARYRPLSRSLPALLAAANSTPLDDNQARAALARAYTLATRLLVKLEDNPLGWMAADRARLLAGGTDPMIAAEAARNLAVLARRAGWYDHATALALDAAGQIDPHAPDPDLAAERGLLLMSAAYTAAKTGDAATMRELTGQADQIAAGLNGRSLLRDHGGGFSPALVTLHRISAEYSLGATGQALAAAGTLNSGTLPTAERRGRYHTDLAQAHAQAGHRDQCLQALLAAERTAPDDTRSRPAVRALVHNLLITGRTHPDLRALAARCGIR